MTGTILGLLLSSVVLGGTVRSPLGPIEIPYRGQSFEGELDYVFRPSSDLLELYLGISEDDTPALYGWGLCNVLELGTAAEHHFGAYAQYSSVEFGLWGRVAGLLNQELNRPQLVLAMGWGPVGARLQLQEAEQAEVNLVLRAPITTIIRAAAANK